MRKYLAILFSLMLLLTLTACGSNTDSSSEEDNGSIIGTWTTTLPEAEEGGTTGTITLDLMEDGTFEMDSSSEEQPLGSADTVYQSGSGKYTASDGKLELTYQEMGSNANDPESEGTEGLVAEDTQSYDYKLSGDELTITDSAGNDQIFTRSEEE